jgi:uncharacterized SAM-binding protein YcdF (DUF218 family)
MHDALVVLGAGFRPDGGISPALRRRAVHAARIYHTGVAPLVLVTGGVNPSHAPYAEADAMSAILTAWGVPDARILREAHARNTAENARLSAAVFLGRGARRVGVVTDPAHMPRALLAFRRAGVAPTPEPVPDAPDSVGTRIREAAAYAVYALRYDRTLRLRF